MNGPSSLADMYVYVVVNADGIETVPYVLLPGWESVHVPVMVPMMAADQMRAASFRRYIHIVPELKGRTIKLVRYTRGTVVDEITLPET